VVPPFSGTFDCFSKVPAEGPYTEMECFIDLKDGSRAMEVKMDTTKKTKMSAEVHFGFQSVLYCFPASERLAW